MPADHAWAIMPVMANPDLTRAAISDVLAQSVPTRLLVIAQGIAGAWRDELELTAQASDGRILIWWHDPPLPSLSASWNAALRFVWETGATDALVVNSDVRLRADTILQLRHVCGLTHALFVSAVGVTGEQFHPEEELIFCDDPDAEHPRLAKGGPDFSCFLITKAGHEQYPFDEGFVPAYCEDLDTHRRYMLGGDGDRIFSINLPFHHVDHGSGTLKGLTPQQRSAHEARIGQSRAHYLAKWGGPVNQETYTIPFEAASAQAGVTTPELQRAIQEGAQHGAES